MKYIKEASDVGKIEYEYLLLAPNIEKRSREFFLRFKEHGIFKKVIIMDYANFHKEITQEQETLFYEDFRGVSTIKITAVDDTDAIRQLCKVGIREDDNIAIDITGFSIPNIYRVMGVFKTVVKIKRVDVFYTEPKFYIYEEGYFDAYHKKIKERQCAPIIGYCNSGEDEREILTIFLGFDGGLADMVYFKLGEEGKEILQTLVVNGFPSYTAKLKDVSLFNNEDLINKIERENVLCTTANNPFETYNLLCSILQKYKGTLLNLCTIGSKPMALGTCLFALDNQNKVKVTYPFYEKTQFDADEESGKTWKYGVVFR
jgi:hypothetical protein